MARPIGARNQGFDDRRRTLLARVQARLVAQDGHTAGMRSLAEAAGVTYPTLKHYFGDRVGLLRALFEARAADGAVYLEQMRQADLPFEQSIRVAALGIAHAGAAPGFRVLHDIGLREGLLSPGVGSIYLEQIFEPTLAAIEARFSTHMARGEMRQADPRVAALGLVSPLLLGALHQHSLDGARLRPLDLAGLAAEIAENFIVAYRAR